MWTTKNLHSTTKIKMCKIALKNRLKNMDTLTAILKRNCVANFYAIFFGKTRICL